MKTKTISIITPCYNEEKGIADCYYAVKKIFENELKSYNYEHIFCDNSSKDKTVPILKEIAEKDKSIKLIVNSRNFGILNNTYNGVLSASGDAVLLFLPVDLQDPPELIPKFVEQWEKGYEIVYGIRAQREEGLIYRTLRKLYYKLLSKITYVDYPQYVGDFQLVDKRIIDEMRRLDETQPFMRIMTFNCGFNSVGVPYTWKARKHGVTHNKFKHMLEQGLTGIISHSYLPLRLMLMTGLLISFSSLIYASWVFMMAVTGLAKPQSGIITLIIGMFFFGGIHLFFLGIIGEYILAIYNKVKKKPLIIEKERVNFD